MVVVNIEQLRNYREYKKDIVMKFLMSYFEDEAESSGNVLDLPYFVKAHNIYNEIIKNSKDLTMYYNKIVENKKHIKKSNFRRQNDIR